MDSNELQEHIRQLNEQERLEHEKKRIIALNKIKQLREQQKQNANKRDVIPQ